MISLAVPAAGWVGVSSPGDYAAFKFPPTPRHDPLRGATGLGWTGVTSIAQQNATLHHGIAGKEITADGTLTVTLGAQTNQGYMGVLSYAPA